MGLIREPTNFLGRYLVKMIFYSTSTVQNFAVYFKS